MPYFCGSPYYSRILERAHIFVFFVSCEFFLFAALPFCRCFCVLYFFSAVLDFYFFFPLLSLSILHKYIHTLICLSFFRLLCRCYGATTLYACGCVSIRKMLVSIPIRSVSFSNKGFYQICTTSKRLHSRTA